MHGAALLALALVAPRAPAPRMLGGLGDMFKKAFSNVDYSESAGMYEQTNARASHILVPTEEQALQLKAQIASGELMFDEAAMKFSTCNSASTGGKLGKFNPGSMVAEFDDVVFGVRDTGTDFVPKYALKEVHGPVATQFGYHLIKIDTRNMADFDFRQAEQAKGNAPPPNNRGVL